MRMRWIALAMAAAVVISGCGGGAQKQGATDPKSPGTAYQQEKGQTGQTQGQTQTQTQQGQAQQPAGAKKWDKPPAMAIDVNKTYTATIKTSLGDMKVELFAKDAPNTVNNFVFLARQKFYDGVIFHRIINGFMVQTGDPNGTGSGGPGYQFADELPPKRPYDLGIVAMANSGKNTNGSQFFICNGARCGGLDQFPNYTQFGKVADKASLEVLQKISTVEVVPNPSHPQKEKSKPVNPPVIQTVVIEEK